MYENEIIKKIVSILVFLLFLLPVRGQAIPADRRVDWQEVVRDDPYKNPDKEVSIMDFGGVPDGKTDNSEAIQNATHLHFKGFLTHAGWRILPVHSCLTAHLPKNETVMV